MTHRRRQALTGQRGLQPRGLSRETRFPSLDVHLVRVADLITTDGTEEGGASAVIAHLPQSGHRAAPTAIAAQSLRGRFVHGPQQTSAVAPSAVLMEKEAADGDDSEHH